MKEYWYNFKFRWKSYPRSAKYSGIGFVLMLVSVIVSSKEQNIVLFIWASTFALLGLVLFFMGIINGFMDLWKHLRRKKDKSDAVT